MSVCGSFSSHWQVFNERLQGYFCRFPEKHFHSLYAVCLSNSKESLIREMLKEQVGLLPSQILCLSSNKAGCRGVDGNLVDSGVRERLMNFLRLMGG